MSYYFNYNDYELLYLIKEGSERAFTLLFNKYDILIYKNAKLVFPYGDKLNDLIQEGRMVLVSCIKSFSDKYEITFYTYFLLCLRRRLYALIKGDYYSLPVLCEEKSYYKPLNIEKIPAYVIEGSILSELDRNIYEECIIGNMPLTLLAKREKLKYTEVYKAYMELICRFKRSFSID